MLSILWLTAKRDLTNDLAARVELGKIFTNKFRGADVKIRDVRVSPAIEATEIHVISGDGRRGAAARVFVFGKRVGLVSAEYPMTALGTVDAALGTIEILP